MKISKNYYTISKRLSEQIFTELKQEHANMSKSEKEKEDLKIQQELNTMISSSEAEKKEHARKLSAEKFSHFKNLAGMATELAQNLQLNIYAKTRPDIYVLPDVYLYLRISSVIHIKPYSFNS